MNGANPFIKWGSIVLFVAINLMIIAVPVSAPTGSSVGTNAALYKGASFFFGCIVLWLAYRKNNFWILLAFTALQWITFTRVMAMLNASM